MTHVRRPRIPGASILFTMTLADRGADTLTRNIDALRDAVQRTKSERPFHIRAMVILPDHLHAIWTLPDGDSDFSIRWNGMKSRFAMAVDKGTPRADPIGCGDHGLWQRQVRAQHIRNEAEKRHLTQACWLDPVRHALASDPFDWPHSSIHRDAIRGVSFDDVGHGVSHVFADRPRDAARDASRLIC